jgi:hypothetical protein
MELALVSGFFCTEGQVQIQALNELKRRVLAAESRARRNAVSLSERLGATSVR